VRESVIDDLCAYYEVDATTCVERCRDWEAWSVKEWQATSRQTPEAIADFYHTTVSWSFDLLWYAYLQAEDAVYPTSVAACRLLPPPGPDARCLDFGSGVGDSAQLLARLGYAVDLADVSQTLLAFARWRLERRGEQARYIDLNEESLPVSAYQVVLAKDVLAHIPDFAGTVARLHRALRPGGLLIANFDTRTPSPENAWHLYDDDLPLRWTLQNAGFEPIHRLDGFLYVYRRVRPSGPAHALRRLRNAFLYGPPRRLYRRARTIARALMSAARRR
jgi:2-polyprenyl-3-methyl-5-hydroxy-6-metoxy-1,4-benzoquinol methylase